MPPSALLAGGNVPDDCQSGGKATYSKQNSTVNSP